MAGKGRASGQPPRWRTGTYTRVESPRIGTGPNGAITMSSRDDLRAQINLGPGWLNWPASHPKKRMGRNFGGFTTWADIAGASWFVASNAYGKANPEVVASGFLEGGYMITWRTLPDTGTNRTYAAVANGLHDSVFEDRAEFLYTNGLGNTVLIADSEGNASFSGSFPGRTGDTGETWQAALERVFDVMRAKLEQLEAGASRRMEMVHGLQSGSSSGWIAGMEKYIARNADGVGPDSYYYVYGKPGLSAAAVWAAMKGAGWSTTSPDYRLAYWLEWCARNNKQLWIPEHGPEENDTGSQGGTQYKTTDLYVLGSPTGGSYALSVGGTSTAAIAWNATAAAVQAAIAAAYPAGNVVVTAIVAAGTDPAKLNLRWTGTVPSVSVATQALSGGSSPFAYVVSGHPFMRTQGGGSGDAPLIVESLFDFLDAGYDRLITDPIRGVQRPLVGGECAYLINASDGRHYVGPNTNEMPNLAQAYRQLLGMVPIPGGTTTPPPSPPTSTPVPAPPVPMPPLQPGGSLNVYVG